MTKLSILKTDTDLREQGYEFCYALDFYITVSCMPNPQVTEYVRKRTNILRRGARSRELDGEQLMQVTREAMAKHVVLDWRGLEDDEGQPIDYSWQKALEIFGDPDCQDIYSVISEVAANQANFRKDEEEESLGNSSSSLNGPSSGSSSRSSSESKRTQEDQVTHG